MTYRDRRGAIPLPSPEMLLGLVAPSFGWNHPQMPRSWQDAPAFDWIVRQDPCSWCGGPGGTVEHVVPRGSGGTNNWDNKAGACFDCNHGRGITPLLEYLAKRAGLQVHVNTRADRLDRAEQLLALQAEARKAIDRGRAKPPVLGTKSRRRLPTYW